MVRTPGQWHEVEGESDTWRNRETNERLFIEKPKKGRATDAQSYVLIHVTDSGARGIGSFAHKKDAENKAERYMEDHPDGSNPAYDYGGML